MPEPVNCPECGTILPDGRGDLDRDVRCAGCGKPIPVESAEWNPYAAPSSTSVDVIEEPGQAQVVPPAVLGKFALAFRLLGTNLPLFSLIILTVWFPADLAIESLAPHAPADRRGFGSLMLFTSAHGVFGPISLGALAFAVAMRMRGERVAYSEAMAVGLRNWGRLFAAKFVAGLLILLGLVALVVPGIVLSIRYSLLDPVVVLEQPADPLRRSRDLTRGRGWRIFFASAIFFAIHVAFAAALGTALSRVVSLEILWVKVGVDCLLNVVASISTIIMVLFYLEARRDRPANLPAEDAGIQFIEDPEVEAPIDHPGTSRW